MFGRLLVVGGNKQMLGAPVLAGTAALRMGSGLVQIAVPRSIPAAARCRSRRNWSGWPWAKGRARGALSRRGRKEVDAIVPRAGAGAVPRGGGRGWGDWFGSTSRWCWMPMR